MLDSSQEFIDKLKCFAPKPDHVMVSFDVVSLFTNIPFTETISTIADSVYDKNNDSLPPFKRDIFVKLMYMATQGYSYIKICSVNKLIVS